MYTRGLKLESLTSKGFDSPAIINQKENTGSGRNSVQKGFFNAEAWNSARRSPVAQVPPTTTQLGIRGGPAGVNVAAMHMATRQLVPRVCFFGLGHRIPSIAVEQAVVAKDPLV